MRIQTSLVVGALCSLLWSGCGADMPRWREYEEYYAEPPGTRPMAGPVSSGSDAPLSWQMPEGWSQQAASSMRLASFGVPGTGATGLCTMVKLGGGGGGVEANIRRWMGQVNITPPSPEEMTAFIEQQARLRTEGGLEGVLVDLLPLGDPGPDVPSMLAALLPDGETTYFVKLTGPRQLLAGEKARFEIFCRSLRREGR